MVDYHVDRPEVEALQDVELTGTNRSEILKYYAPLVAALEVLLRIVFEAKISRRDRLELRLAIALGDQG